MLDDLVLNVRKFGAAGNDLHDDATAIQAAIDALPADGGIVFFPTGNYRVGSTLRLKTPQTRLIGASFRNAALRPSPANASLLREFLSVEASDCEVSSLLFLPEADGTICVHVRDTNRSAIRSNWFQMPDTQGVAIQFTNTNPTGGGHYNHYVCGNWFNGQRLTGIAIAGQFNASVIRENKFNSDFPIRLEAEAGGAGGANVIRDNLIQSVSGGPGNPLGVAISCKNQFSNIITGNYVESFRHGVMNGDGSSNNVIGPNHWDNVPNMYGIEGSGAVPSYVSGTGEGVQVERLFAQDVPVLSDNSVIPIQRCIHVHGAGAVRRGCALGVRVQDGQQLRILGTSDPVQVVPGGTAIFRDDQGVFFGNAADPGFAPVVSMDLTFFRGKWIENCRTTRS
jgi:hypothetical protein